MKLIIAVLMFGSVVFQNQAAAQQKPSQAPAEEIKMPHQLRINGAFWHIMDVEKIGADPHTVARADCKTQMILLRINSPEAMKAEALTHELEHAFTCESGLMHNEKFNNNAANQDDHRGVYWSANQWHRFMVENAAFIRWVTFSGLFDVQLAEGIDGRSGASSSGVADARTACAPAGQ